MTDLIAATQQALGSAERIFQSLLNELPRRGLARDPQVIATVGDLQVRLAAARALTRQASAGEASPVRDIQARLAAEDARRFAGELQQDWLAEQASPRPPGPTPRELQRLLGEQHLALFE